MRTFLTCPRCMAPGLKSWNLTKLQRRGPKLSFSSTRQHNFTSAQQLNSGIWSVYEPMRETRLYDDELESSFRTIIETKTDPSRNVPRHRKPQPKPNQDLQETVRVAEKSTLGLSKALPKKADSTVAQSPLVGTVTRQKEEALMKYSIESLVYKWASNISSPDRTTPSMFLQSLNIHDFTIIPVEWWLGLIIRMLAILSQKEVAETKNGTYPSEAFTTSLRDIFAVWDLYFRVYSFHDLDQPAEDAHTGKTTSTKSMSNSTNTDVDDIYSFCEEFPSKLSNIFLEIHKDKPRLWSQPLSYAAILTRDLSLRVLHSKSKSWTFSQSWPRELWQSLSDDDGKVLSTSLYSSFRSLDIPHSVCERIAQDLENAKLGAKSTSHEFLASNRRRVDASHYNTLLHEYHTACIRNDARTIHVQWENFLARLHDSSLKEPAAMDPAHCRSIEPILAEFAKSFIINKEPERLFDIFRLIDSSEYTPSDSFWVLMLESSVTARDLVTQDAIWRQLQDKGIKISREMWVQRAKGLLQDRTYWRNGMKILSVLAAENVGQMRKSVNQQDTHQPSQNVSEDVFSFGIAAMLRLRHEDQAWTIFQWTKACQCLDVKIMNILLAYMSRERRADDMRYLLDMFKDLNLKPDVATFTVILQHALRNYKPQSQDQYTAILSIFRQMKEENIKPNVYSYGVLIYEVLHQSGDMRIVNMLIDHMSAQGVVPSTHIYTSILDHYFTQSPPDLKSIDLLWKKVNRLGRRIDQIFYDRMIEGYARVREVDKMMKIFRGMHSKGVTAGWIARTELMNALVYDQQWDVLAEVLRDAQLRRGAFVTDPTANKGKIEFCELVRDLAASCPGQQPLGAKRFP